VLRTIALIYATLVTLFFHIHPLISSQAEYWIHLLPFVAALELLLVMLAGEVRRVPAGGCASC